MHIPIKSCKKQEGNIHLICTPCYFLLVFVFLVLISGCVEKDFKENKTEVSKIPEISSGVLPPANKEPVNYTAEKNFTEILNTGNNTSTVNESAGDKSAVQADDKNYVPVLSYNVSNCDNNTERRLVEVVAGKDYLNIYFDLSHSCSEILLNLTTEYLNRTVKRIGKWERFWAEDIIQEHKLKIYILGANETPNCFCWHHINATISNLLPGEHIIEIYAEDDKGRIRGEYDNNVTLTANIPAENISSITLDEAIKIATETVENYKHDMNNSYFWKLFGKVLEEMKLGGVVVVDETYYVYFVDENKTIIFYIIIQPDGNYVSVINLLINEYYNKEHDWEYYEERCSVSELIERLSDGAAFVKEGVIKYFYKDKDKFKILLNTGSKEYMIEGFLNTTIIGGKEISNYLISDEPLINKTAKISGKIKGITRSGNITFINTEYVPCIIEVKCNDTRCYNLKERLFYGDIDWRLWGHKNIDDDNCGVVYEGLQAYIRTNYSELKYFCDNIEIEEKYKDKEVIAFGEGHCAGGCGFTVDRLYLFENNSWVEVPFKESEEFLSWKASRNFI